MKKLKYVGDQEVIIPQLGVLVKNGDVIDAPDDFNNANFQAVKSKEAPKGDK